MIRNHAYGKMYVLKSDVSSGPQDVRGLSEVRLELREGDLIVGEEHGIDSSSRLIRVDSREACPGVSK